MFYQKAERVKSDVKYLQKSLKDTIVPEVSYIFISYHSVPIYLLQFTFL